MEADAKYYSLIQSRFGCLLHREILRLRGRYQLSLDEFRGLYVSDEQVDALLNQARENNKNLPDNILPDLAQLTVQAGELSEQSHIQMPESWQQIKRHFHLSDLEMDIIQLAMLMELDNKYEVLFGYLNNDVSRKYPTLDMALRLFDEDAAAVRIALSQQGKLFANRLLFNMNSNTQSLQHGALSQGFRTDFIVSSYLFGLPYADPELDGFLNWWHLSDQIDKASKEKYRKFAQIHLAQAALNDPCTVSIIEGLSGTGRVSFAGIVSQNLGKQCCIVDLDGLPADQPGVASIFGRLHLQLSLSNSAVAFNLHNMDASKPQYRELRRLMNSHAWKDIPVFLLVEPGCEWRALVADRAYQHQLILEPDSVARKRLWLEACNKYKVPVDEKRIAELAGHFLLTPKQIEQAIRSIGLVKLKEPVSRQLLFQAAREQSTHELDKLAQKVTTRYRWGDVVLPPYTERNVLELTAAIRNRHRVYGEWNMGWRTGNVHGLVGMFSGASGTGKTITASVIANEIGLDLYRVDLASVVSKYIGETEKNLDKIFDAARRANVMLFLDECDSLMGKRSEVKDAHDRYANLEVSYLLQKMEFHEGVVILATNFAKNMDQAFSRRMHYVIEFGRPNETEREKLWRGMFPQDTPLADDINFNFLADQFELPGGDIRIIALDAAFLAAQNGQIINMEHLVNATARQLIKQGKAPGATEFKQYQQLLQ
ncbi:MAG: ATP-binding protein [Arenicellales bacterium]